MERLKIYPRIKKKTWSHVYPYTQQQIARRSCLYHYHSSSFVISFKSILIVICLNYQKKIRFFNDT